MKKISFIITATVIFLYSCETQQLDYSADQNSSTGTGGSLARFIVSGNFLFTVEGSILKTFDITNEKQPEQTGETYVNADIETIFASGNLIFLGTRSGVYIYDITHPASPEYVSFYSHVRSCDPVVVRGNYAYSTLNTSGPCSNGADELDVIDISNPENPYLVHTLGMENPRGLGISGSLLFVCDNGLKVYDLTTPDSPLFIKKIVIDAVDVIPVDTLLLVATEQGLSEYSIDSLNDIHFVSSIYQ